jgi:hypothetical protein
LQSILSTPSFPTEYTLHDNTLNAFTSLDKINADTRYYFAVVSVNAINSTLVSSESILEMEARVRLTPYYFLIDGSAQLTGILATLCPHDKKKIHGMSEAVLMPCAKLNN